VTATPAPSADAPDPGDRTADETAELTIDELSAKVGTTVRTTRYYASLGLIPPPVRRGRVAYYGDAHVARLEMVRALQDHGFTLQAIERYMTSLPAGASTEDLALQRAMLTSWTTEPPERVTWRQVEKRARRPLSEDDMLTLVALRAVEPAESDGEGGDADDGGSATYVLLPGFDLGVEMLGVEVPTASLVAASEIIDRHMTALADELTEVLREQVVRPYRAEPHTAAEAARMEATVANLRRVTLEGVVVGFQRAANQVIQRSLKRR